MKNRISFFVLLFLSSSAFAKSKIPPLDKYGGAYDKKADSNGIHYHFYVEPKWPQIEAQLIYQDMVTLWLSTTALSECSRFKAVNLILEKKMDPYLLYPPGVIRSTVPFSDTSLNVCTEGKSFY